jgi:N6-L-threonylcarbamoyladenine synthase
MNLLSIETSCDETALSIIQFDKDNPQHGFKVLSNLVISQIDVHKEYGGVFPKIAKREHARNLTPLLVQALKEAGMYYESNDELSNYQKKQLSETLEREPELNDALTQLLNTIKQPAIDALCVTQGPGLSPALWVGVNFARALSSLWNIPIHPINHMEGHITSILLKENYQSLQQAHYPSDSFQFPMIALLISGGHTQLVLVKNWGEYHILGETVDDAVGEAFDKVARMLSMPYPGGPQISKAALLGTTNEDIVFPRPMIHTGDYQCSFSGLKTAVRYRIEAFKQQGILDTVIPDIAREFQQAVTDVLVTKTAQAMQEHQAQGLIVAGGVSANAHIREALQTMVRNECNDVPVYLPLLQLCGDNSLMIATAAYLSYLRGNPYSLDYRELRALPSLTLGDTAVS